MTASPDALTDDQAEQGLLMLRVQLYAAAQRLRGKQLDQLDQLVKEIAGVIESERGR